MRVRHFGEQGEGPELARIHLAHANMVKERAAEFIDKNQFFEGNHGCDATFPEGESIVTRSSAEWQPASELPGRLSTCPGGGPRIRHCSRSAAIRRVNPRRPPVGRAASGRGTGTCPATPRARAHRSSRCEKYCRPTQRNTLNPGCSPFR